MHGSNPHSPLSLSLSLSVCPSPVVRRLVIVRALHAEEVNRAAHARIFHHVDGEESRTRVSGCVGERYVIPECSQQTVRVRKSHVEVRRGQHLRVWMRA